MNPLLAVASVAALALVAAAGVVAGYRRRDPVPVEPVADPLEDRRTALLRSLGDLEEARTTGALEDADYRRLRHDTDGRMARLLNAIDQRELRASRAAADPPVDPVGSGHVSGRVPPWAVATLLAATVGAVLVVALLRESEPAPVSTAVTSDDPFAFFEQRVRDHPNDLAARLDLAHRYLDAGRIEEALAEYAVALELDPDDAEAHAHVGMILYLSDRPEEALGEVETALEAAPDYPEALFIRGVIQLCGLDRGGAATDSFERYLDVAPFGSERGASEELIAGIAAGTERSELCGG
ncbi:MAG: tetratricopeptide repeat protein [Actinomycetota bacterium]